MKPVILLLSPAHHAATRAVLESEFDCRRLFEAEDRDAFLREHGGEIRAIASYAQVRVSAELMAALPKLELIAHFGVGVDNVDLAAARARGIVVTNTPDVLTDCTADTAMALIVNTLRKFARSEAYLREGRWEKEGPYPLTTSLSGKTLGVLGLGRIGEAIVRRATAFGMKIRYHNRRPKDVPFPYDPDPVTLARESDVLVIVTPGGAETEKLVGAAVLDALGPQGYVINIARGSVIDEPVLLRYLQEKRIAGAGLDVFTDEPRVPAAFLALESVVLFPHVGSGTNETRAAMGRLQIENLRRHFAGRPTATPVR